MSDSEMEFMDQVFKLINIARDYGIFDNYFRAQDVVEPIEDPVTTVPESSDNLDLQFWSNIFEAAVDMFESWIPGNALTSQAWQISGPDFEGWFNGTFKAKIKIVTNLRSPLGSAFGIGYPTHIALDREWVNCSKKLFNDTSEYSASRICGALEVAGTLVHEMVHHAAYDWREAPAYSIEGYFRYHLWKKLSKNGALTVEALALIDETELPTNWDVLECATKEWPCGTEWHESWHKKPCDLECLVLQVDEWTGCG